jgi:hypothetical protein
MFCHILFSSLYLLGEKSSNFKKQISKKFATFLLRFGGGEGTFCTSFLTFWKGYRNLFPFNAKSLLDSPIRHKQHEKFGKNL